MGCCGSKKENEVELSSLKEFPPLEENIDQNIICRKYPFDILAPNCLQNPEDIKTYRVVVIGDKKVGKSQIIDRFQKKGFLEEYEPTIEQEVMIMHKVPLNEHSGLLTHDVNDFYDCLLRVLDTAGMGGALAVNTENDVYVTDTTKLREWIIKGHIFLLVFDLTNKESFEHIESFYEEISKTKQIDNPPIILVGNKCDLVFNDRDKGQFATYNANSTSGKPTDATTTTATTMITNKNTILSTLDATLESNHGTLNSVGGDSSVFGTRQDSENARLLVNDFNKTLNMKDVSTGHVSTGTVESIATSGLSVGTNGTVGTVGTMVEHNSDLDERQVSPNQIFKFCMKYNVPYIECSAKIPYNIETIFNIALKESLLFQEMYGKDMRAWMRIKRTMSMEKQDGHYSLHN